MGARFSAPVHTGPGAHPASCTMGTGSFPGAKSGRGVTLTPHPLLVPWSRKGRVIPLLSLWAVRPVQSLSACTSGHFTFTFTFIATLDDNPVSGIIAKRDSVQTVGPYANIDKRRESNTNYRAVICLSSFIV